MVSSSDCSGGVLSLGPGPIVLFRKLLLLLLQLCLFALSLSQTKGFVEGVSLLSEGLHPFIHKDFVLQLNERESSNPAPLLPQQGAPPAPEVLLVGAQWQAQLVCRGPGALPARSVSPRL